MPLDLDAVMVGFPFLTNTPSSGMTLMAREKRFFWGTFTRCTLGYSKKLDNLRYAVALFIAHFNFCRVHSAHGLTPARAAGLTDHAWTLGELLSATI